MTVCLLLVMAFSMTAYAAETEGNGIVPIASLAEENAGQTEKGTQEGTEIYTGVSDTGTEILMDSYTNVSDMTPETMQEWETAEEIRIGQVTENTQETVSVAEIQTIQESVAAQETETAQETENAQERETAQETEIAHETETAQETETGSGEITVSDGCLKITMTDADDQEKKLYGAVFSVFNTENGEKAGELMTGMDGTASLILSVGSYTLRETFASDGYELSSECTAFSIQEGSVTELAVTNRKIKQMETKAEPGALRITKRDSDSGERLKGAVFGIYHADTDNHVETVTTDRRGVAEVELEPGNYYYLELEAPNGYVLEEEKTCFSIESGRTREITVNNRKEEESSAETETKNSLTTAVSAVSVPTAVPVLDSMTKDAENEIPADADENQTDESHSDETKKPEDDSGTETAAKSGRQTGDSKNDKKNGTLWIQNMGAGTGEKLSGAVFAVYGSGNKKAGELAVKNGKASLSLPQGSYYLKEVKAAPGYGVEAVRIHFTVAAGGITLIEITSETDLENTNPQELIPKTGETPPLKIYAFALLCYLTAILCGLVLWKDGHSGAGHGTITPIKRGRISVWGNITKSVRPVAEK